MLWLELELAHCWQKELHQVMHAATALRVVRLEAPALHLVKALPLGCGLLSMVMLLKPPCVRVQGRCGHLAAESSDAVGS